MATRVCEFSFLFLLSILTLCSSGPSALKDFEEKELKREEKQIFHLSSRVLSSNPAPAVVNVPSTNPTASMVTVPSATSVSVPNTTLPVTNPVTTPSTNPGAVPVTNPAANPTPPGGVPSATPGAPPATTNAPVTPGQSWCVAKSGAQQTVLQAGLDYACGKGADCAAIQQGGSCYNPNTLQNHASYAFNSYYLKNPAPTSCDFGGAATLTNTNPSTGSCVYPTSGSSVPTPGSGNPTPASPTSPGTANPTPPASPMTPGTGYAPPGTGNPTPASPTSPGTGVPGVGAPPFVLNSSNPTSGGTFPASSPSFDTSTSDSSALRPLISCIVLVTSIITGKHSLNV